jgi:AraC-like DNA-binding protein
VIARNQPIVGFLPRDVHARGAWRYCSGVAARRRGPARRPRGHRCTGARGRDAHALPRARWQPDDLVTEEDGVYCGGGVHAALDLALYLVDRLAGRDTARECAKALVLDMPRECQAGFSVLPVGARHEDEAVRRAERFIHGHCREDVRFDALARELGMSPRNFMRRFKEATGSTPLEYLQRLRVRAAQRMLEDDHTAVSEVAAAVGYECGVLPLQRPRARTRRTAGGWRRARLGCFGCSGGRLQRAGIPSAAPRSILPAPYDLLLDLGHRVRHVGAELRGRRLALRRSVEIGQRAELIGGEVLLHPVVHDGSDLREVEVLRHHGDERTAPLLGHVRRHVGDHVVQEILGRHRREVAVDLRRAIFRIVLERAGCRSGLLAREGHCRYGEECAPS